MSTQTAVQTQALPRVNLLPPEIAEHRKLQQLKVILGGTVLASVGVVLALYLAAVGQVHGAQNDLDAAKAKHQQLNVEASRYATVPAAQTALASAQTQLSQAMGQEVRWSFLLNDLSLRVPNNVWLTKLTIAENVDGSTAPTTSGNASTGLFTPGLGQVSIDGKAMTQTDVAAWLDSLAKEKGLNQVFFTKSDQGLVGTTKDYEFSSQATITQDALSKRYTTKAGS